MTDDAAVEAVPSHPEEMKGTVKLRIGKIVTVTATGRATPAGFVCAAMLAGAVLLPFVLLARRRPPRV